MTEAPPLSAAQRAAAAQFAELALPLVQRRVGKPAAGGPSRPLLYAVLQAAFRVAIRHPRWPATGANTAKVVELPYLELERLIDQAFSDVPAAQQELLDPDLLFQTLPPIFAALLQSGFGGCRLSYQVLDEPTRCSRQDPAQAGKRVAGAFCEDCPFWSRLTREKHVRVLQMSWQAPETIADLRDEAEALLPEGFRDLRKFIDQQRILARP